MYVQCGSVILNVYSNNPDSPTTKEQSSRGAFANMAKFYEELNQPSGGHLADIIFHI